MIPETDPLAAHRVELVSERPEKSERMGWAEIVGGYGIAQLVVASFVIGMVWNWDSPAMRFFVIVAFWSVVMVLTGTIMAGILDRLLYGRL